MSLKNSIKEFKALLGDEESLLDINYPKISEMIKLHWGYKEIYLYINKLLVVDKDRSRQGFPIEVIKEIYLLQEIHEKLFPGLKKCNWGGKYGKESIYSTLIGPNFQSYNNFISKAAEVNDLKNHEMKNLHRNYRRLLS